MIQLQNKYFISGELFFATAFHIGSGKAGDGKVDNGILKDLQGRPVLPGSSLKGCFRSLAERIAHSLDLKACFLDMSLCSGEDFECVNGVSDERYRDLKKEIMKSKNPLNYLQENNHLCDICNLFGSKMHASRIFFSDGSLTEWNEINYVRDGVVIDRDTETARDKLKYDFEVAPDSTRFKINIEVENLSAKETRLVQAVLTIWEEGFSLGGNSSRGLGKVNLEKLKIQYLDFNDKKSFNQFILKRKNGLREVSLGALV